jgi:Flp pilus assembly protein TadD
MRGGEAGQQFESLAHLFNDMKIYDSAIYYYKMVIRENPRNTVALNNMGAAYMLLERNDSAFIYYLRSAGLDSNNYNASLNLGILYHLQGQYQTAITYIRNAIRINPRNGKAYFDLACSYALINNSEQAIYYLRQAFERGFKNYSLLLTDPDLTGLKNYKEFHALLDKYIPDWRD